MVLKRIAFTVLFICIALFYALAQPLLPCIAGKAGGGGVTLSWVCQYTSIKTIGVLHAAGSSDFTLIGYVQQINKGPQNFTDSKPLPGKNCYKLVVEFKSGLIWRSNDACVIANKNMLEFGRPPVHQPNDGGGASNNTNNANKQPLIGPQQIPPATIQAPIDKPVPPPFKSKYIYTDAITGDINMTLPDDVASHLYSIKFFDLQNHLLADVPRIGNAKIIFDRRNFQRKEIIRFVLKKDGIQLEDGYVKTLISPR
jgi:hypothetical protein